MQIEDGENLTAEDSLGTFKAGSGKWGSCLRIVNPLLVSGCLSTKLGGPTTAASKEENSN